MQYFHPSNIVILTALKIGKFENLVSCILLDTFKAWPTTNWYSIFEKSLKIFSKLLKWILVAFTFQNAKNGISDL